MLISVRNLKCHVAAADRGRYALHTIALTAKGTISTNGRQLLFIPYPDHDPELVPSIDGVDAASPAPEKPVLIETADAAKAAAMPPAKHFNEAFRMIHANVNGEQVCFGATDGGTFQTLTVGQAEGGFPDYARVIPDFSEALAVTFDIDLLLKALRIIKAASTQEYVTMRVLDDEKGVGFSCQDGVALLQMPMQIGEEDGHVPDAFAELRTDSPVEDPDEAEENEEETEESGDETEESVDDKPLFEDSSIEAA